VSIREIWYRVVKTRYTRALEVEVAQLRAENRALLNSILGIAGIPPILVDLPTAAEQGANAEPAAELPGTRGIGLLPSSPRQKVRANSMQGSQRMAGVPAPVRHRSWQQVNRMLEFEASRKREDLGEMAKAVGQT
jgi:hypothetical protein